MLRKDEIDIAITELDSRIDRLRALYEQYFLGIERQEPYVPRKDVERRIAELRKTRFQNTAKRFKFQTLVQKYNTMQQYWNRTCREIENGTYRRHKLKAERTIGTLDQVRRIAEGKTDPKEIEQELRDRAETAGAARETAERDLEALLSGGTNLDDELAGALAALEDSPSTPTSSASGDRTQTAIRAKDDSDDAPGGSLLSRLSGAADGSDQSGTSGSLGSLLAGIRPSVGPLPALTSPAVGQRPPPPSMRARAPSPPSTATSAAATSPQATSPRAAAPRAEVSPRAATSPRASTGARRSATASSDFLSEERIRKLHAAYQDARTQTNARSVSLEKLSRSIRDTERKLQAKHKGRSVDFDVVIKNGKAILKPRLG